MPQTYFILGTDTDCGKTYVTCELLRYFQNKQQKALAIKPVASGCDDRGGILVNDDVLRLEQQNAHQQEICRWRFRQPISPHLAATLDGQTVFAQDIVDFCLEKSSPDLDYLLIEGAGGLMVPINEHETWIDVLTLSKISVILVVGMRLGCLNHALLTIHALNSYGIRCEGWIANCLDPDMLALNENIQTLQKKIMSPLLAVVRYQGDVQMIL